MYKLNKETSQRIEILRVLLITLAVFAHSYSTYINFQGNKVIFEVPNWLEVIKWVISCTLSDVVVPLFLMISSVLLFMKDFKWKDNTIKKIKTILIPYLFWNTFWILIFFIAQQLTVTASFFANPSNIIADFGIRQWIDAYIGCFERSPYPFLYPFWLLRDLFIMNVLAVVVKKLVDKLPILTFIGLCALLFGNIPSLPFLSNTAIVFFTLGYYAVKYNLKMEMLDRLSWLQLHIGYLSLITIEYIFSARYPVLTSVTMLFGVIYFIRLSKAIYDAYRIKEKFLKLSAYMFIVYALHEMTVTILKKLCAKVFEQTAVVQLLQYFAIPIAVIAGAVLVGCIMRRYVHALYAFATGNR